jgi:predicted lactoylglutathione lyase
MKLGAFSVSLSVKDLIVSKEFYEKLGFSVFGGEIAHNYLIMKNGDTVIGLFQGMFEGNILTFNPGWDQDCNILESFEDVHQLKQQVQDKGIALTHEVDHGPKSFTLQDPDGNAILIDQHV